MADITRNVKAVSYLTLGITTVPFVAGEDLTKGDLVHMGTDGKVYKADNTTLDKARAIGVVVNGDADGVVPAGNGAAIAIAGLVAGYQANPGTAFYVGATPGVPADAPPAAGSGAYAFRVGVMTDKGLLIQIGGEPTAA